MSPLAAPVACSEPRCPRDAVERGRCAEHRLTTAQRGYGTIHESARDQLERTLPAPCAYGCGTLLHRSGPWVAAHVIDGDATAGWVAACPMCNERAKHEIMTVDRSRVLQPLAGPSPLPTRPQNFPQGQNDPDRSGFA